MSFPDEVCPACGQEVFDIDVTCGKCGHALSSTGAQRLIGEVVLGQYTISDILGQGGMSVVYRGKHSVTGQEVALKVLPPDLAAYRDVKSRFLEEGRALAQLDHPNIVHLYNFGSDGDSLVLAMQFVRGKTWERVIMEQERLSWQQSAKLTSDVARALDYAHGRGIIHRDMKPSNVLIRDLDGAATVMDFGIAKMQSSTKLTATGQTMGTVRYMSPEQVRGKPVDERTDIYSLAITTYESVVGDTPFTGDTHFEIMTKHLNEVPVPPSRRGIDVPPSFEAVLMRAISKSPEDRQSSAKEFTEQLEAAMAGAPVETSSQAISFGETLPFGSAASASTTPSPVDNRQSSASASPTEHELLPTRVRRRGLAVGLALLVIAGGATTFFLSRGESEPQQARSEPPPAPDATPKSAKEILDEAFVLPGVEFAVDETFVEDKLRILSVEAVDVAEVRIMVLKARATFAGISKELSWPSGEIGQSLSLVLVPQSTLCNPQLDEKGVAPEDCNERQAGIRPREETLYLVPGDPKKLQTRIDYWVAMTSCIRGTVGNCTDIIQKRLGE
tara:strand:- start:57220 stop:58893 length:1674 start_codon:yes stop_codon:yes gene_type:complete